MIMSKRRSINIVSGTANVVARSLAFPITEQRDNEGGTTWQHCFICQKCTS